MIFKESTLKEMEYRYVKKNICRAESGFLYDRKYAHKCWKRRWIGFDWIWASKFRVLFHEKPWLERKRIRRKRIC